MNFKTKTFNCYIIIFLGIGSAHCAHDDDCILYYMMEREI